MRLGELFKRVYRSRLGMSQQAKASSESQADFVLLYDKLRVGNLSLHDGRWRFEYTDEFREHPELRPLTEFPDTERRYESDELWPFFATRIPSLKRAEVKEVIDEESIDSRDQLQLLRRFGKRTISNPFVLVESLGV